MNRLRDLLNDLSRALAAMSPRERMLVSLAGVAAVIFVSSIVFSSMSSAISRRETAIEEKRMSLEQVAVYAQTFAESERARKEIESKLGGSPIRLMTLMQDLADRNGLTVGSMSDRGDSQDGGVKTSVVDVTIASTPVDKLTAVLNEIDRNPRPVKVRKMRVKRNSADETLNVTLTVATYQLIKS